MNSTEDASFFVANSVVLIVEDNPVNMKLAKILISNAFPEFALLEAENGEEAVDAFEKNKPDLILMDIQMPVMHGYEATRKIRAIEIEKGGHVPIIALTASIVQDEIISCKEAGMDDFLNKPIIKDQLFAKIRHWLNANKC
jgi:CheY-like chemotaxis protein